MCKCNSTERKTKTPLSQISCLNFVQIHIYLHTKTYTHICICRQPGIEPRRAEWGPWSPTQISELVSNLYMFVWKSLNSVEFAIHTNEKQEIKKLPFMWCNQIFYISNSCVSTKSVNNTNQIFDPKKIYLHLKFPIHAFQNWRLEMPCHVKT
jgi:hypothetical protein